VRETGAASRWIGGVVLAALVLSSIFPFLWAVVASLTPEAGLFEGASILPKMWVTDHYRALMSEHKFWIPVRNSVVVAGITTLICLAAGSFCAYALARMRLRGRGMILGFLLSIVMFPQISILSPLYLLLRGLRWINTFAGLIVPYVGFALPLTIWLLTGFFRQLPGELEEAAMVDGASRLTVFSKVILPLSWPALATSAILTFTFCWNEFLFALSFTTGPERRTIPVAVALFRGQYQVPWGEILAASVVASLPLILLMIIFQKRIVEGLTAGALKG
jgi:ABC-type glycerol-3-phosphate transport system permease component